MVGRLFGGGTTGLEHGEESLDVYGQDDEIL